MQCSVLFVVSYLQGTPLCPKSQAVNENSRKSLTVKALRSSDLRKSLIVNDLGNFRKSLMVNRLGEGGGGIFLIYLFGIYYLTFLVLSCKLIV